MVQFHLFMVGKSDVTVESRLYWPGPGVSPTFPKINPKQKSNDEFPHCLVSLVSYLVSYLQVRYGALNTSFVMCCLISLPVYRQTFGDMVYIVDKVHSERCKQGERRHCQ